MDSNFYSCHWNWKIEVCLTYARGISYDRIYMVSLRRYPKSHSENFMKIRNVICHFFQGDLVKSKQINPICITLAVMAFVFGSI